MSDTPSQAQRSSVERHAQTLIGAVMLGLVSWVGYTVTNLNAQFARLDEPRDLVHVGHQGDGDAALVARLFGPVRVGIEHAPLEPDRAAGHQIHHPKAPKSGSSQNIPVAVARAAA